MDITPNTRDQHHLVVFNVAPYVLCAPAVEVEAIIVVPHIYPLPQAPPSIIGVAQHRGQMYRVISLRRKLGLEANPPSLEGQLILTRLAVGRTAFLVDAVVDVLPAVGFVRQPLSPHHRMDFFDAFLLRNEQILLHTTFDRMEQARETPFPNPDLITTADTTGSRVKASETAPEAEQPEATPPRPLPERDREPATDPKAGFQRETHNKREGIPDANTNQPAPPLPPPMQIRPPRETMTSFPARRPRFRETRNAGSRRSLGDHRRTRRQAIALTAFLVMLLFVVLSSAFWIKARLILRQQPSHKEETISPGSERSAQTATPLRASPPVPSQESTPTVIEVPAVLPLPPPADRSPGPRATEMPAKSSDYPSNKVAANASGRISAQSESSGEILRLDTDAFTLTVERPAAQNATISPPPDRQRMIPGDEITHRVVSGDTLWDIASHYLGDPFQYPELARLSQIRDPDLIYPGDLVRIRMKAAAQETRRNDDGPIDSNDKR